MTIPTCLFFTTHRPPPTTTTTHIPIPAQIKQPVVATFRPLADQLTAPVLMDAPDMSKFDRPAQLHCLFRALSEFQLKVRCGVICVCEGRVHDKGFWI